jgi:predicted acetyltransferase
VTVEIRQSSPDDLPALLIGDGRAFHYQFPSDATDEIRGDVDFTRFFHAFDDAGTLVGNTGTFEFDVTMPGGASLPCGGVTWVFVDSLHRRQGILTQLMARQHAQLLDEGKPISFLQASEAPIYGRFGYGEVVRTREVEVDRRFAVFRPDAPDPGGVRHCETDELRKLAPEIHRRWCAVTPAALSRSAPWWDRLLRDKPEHRHGMTAYFHLVHADGYASYRIKHGTKLTLNAEIFAATDDAHAALWRALLSKDLVDAVTTYSAPLDDPLPFLLTDQRLVTTTSVDDGMWGRILDVEVVLGARTYATEIDVVLDVADPFLDRGGRFRLTGGPDGATCRRVDTGGEIAVGIADLASMVFGTHRAATLARSGRLTATDPALLRRVDAAFGTERAARNGTDF